MLLSPCHLLWWVEIGLTGMCLFRYRQASVFLVNFESRNGEIVHRLRGHTSSVCSLSWCPVPGEDILNISLGTSHDSGTGLLTVDTVFSRTPGLQIT